MFCQKCGNEVNNESILCEHCGNSLKTPTESQTKNQPLVNNEPLDGGVKVISFCFPIVGGILYFVHQKSAPQKSKDACHMALWGFGVGVVLNILSAILTA